MVADALYRHSYLLTIVDAQVLGFEHLKELYKDDADFWEKLSHPEGLYVVHEGFLFKGNKFFVHMCGVRSLLVREVHIGGVAGHLEVQKTLDTL